MSIRKGIILSELGFFFWYEMQSVYRVLRKEAIFLSSEAGHRAEVKFFILFSKY